MRAVVQRVSRAKVEVEARAAGEIGRGLVVLLAAGEGTRLRPYTLDRPKPMVLINGKPLLEHTLVWLRQYGVKDVAINLHYRPEVPTLRSQMCQRMVP